MKTIISLAAVKIPTAEEIVEGLQKCGINPHKLNKDMKIAGGKATFSIECDKPMYIDAFSGIVEHVDNVSDVMVRPHGSDLEITIIFLK